MRRRQSKEQELDLFTTRDFAVSSANQSGLLSRSQHPRRWALPKDLGSALQFLDDEQIHRLLNAVTEEAKRRGRRPANTKLGFAKADASAPQPPLKQAWSTGGRKREASLTKGQVKAVHAAFRAGVTPSRIARQFGLSQAQVRKALATDKT